MKCEVEGCEREAASGRWDMCGMHYKRWYRYGDTSAVFQPVKPSKERWLNQFTGYIAAKDQNGRLTYEHLILAEKALGRKLPKGAQVHHTGDPWDNFGFCKLVICPDQSYHKLLHRRMKAQAAGERLPCE